MPGALAGEKERHVYEHAPAHPMARQSRRGAGRQPIRKLWFIFQLGLRLKRLYETSADPKDEAIQALTWDYPIADEKGEPDVASVLKEMNGYTVADRKQIGSFQELKEDGSTACGAWLYSGVFPKEDDNRARSRRADGSEGPGTHLDWAWAWPANRRNMYNRASADPDGKPWSERKRLCIGTPPKKNGSAPTSPISSPISRRTTSRTGQSIPRAWTRSAATARSS